MSDQTALRWPGIFWDLDGRPLDDVEIWSRLFGSPERIIQQTELIDRRGDLVRVSTVWLGLDMGHGFTAAPLIYETMVFGGREDELQRRWPTRSQALRGHLGLCRDLVPRELPPGPLRANGAPRQTKAPSGSMGEPEGG